MAVFQDTPEEWERLDWMILQNGWVSVYWRTALLERDLIWFQGEHYSCVSFDCATWRDEMTMHDQLRDKLAFPDYYGNNYDALNDCLRDLTIPEPGQIVVFRQFDHNNKDRRHTLLDIFTHNARRHMLFGKRLIVVVQVSDPKIQFDTVGATPVCWNNDEWLKSSRK